RVAAADLRPYPRALGRVTRASCGTRTSLATETDADSGFFTRQSRPANTPTATSTYAGKVADAKQLEPLGAHVLRRVPGADGDFRVAVLNARRDYSPSRRGRNPRISAVTATRRSVTANIIVPVSRKTLPENRRPLVPFCGHAVLNFAGS